MYVQPGKPRRPANALARLEGFYSLAQLIQMFPSGIDPLHVAWMWRRVLVAIAHGHDNNVVHGAVVPEHIMILPEQHGVVLADWCYASIREPGEIFQQILAIVPARKDFYPEE